GAAELSVARPQSALAAHLERVNVNEPWRGTFEEDIERCGVLENEALVETDIQGLERHQRRVAEHGKAPLVAVRHEGQLRLPDHLRAHFRWSKAFRCALDKYRGDKESGRGQCVDEAVVSSPDERCERFRGRGAVDRSGVSEESSGG